MPLTKDELNKALKPHLHTVVKEKITLDEDEAETNIKIISDVLERLVTAMREEDDLFDELYQQLIYTGSYFENLRVKSATQFDVNIVLRLPFDRYDVEIDWCRFDSAYVTYQLHDEPENLLTASDKNRYPFSKIIKEGLFDLENFLQQDKVCQWIQSIVNKVLQGRFQQSSDLILIKDSTSGPAFTYCLTTRWGENIDVDLVPVIDGCPYETLEVMDQGESFENLTDVSKNTWFLVPKPFKMKTHDGKTEKPMPARYWQIFFSEAEKELLKNTGCLTMLIKLFKLLRDCHEYWGPLASYFIKTFCLLEYDRKDCQQWEPANIGTLFVEMLKSFQTAIKQRHIPYYFNRRANLLSAMSAETSDFIENSIHRICCKIEHDPNYVLELYHMPSAEIKGVPAFSQQLSAIVGGPQEEGKEKSSLPCGMQ